MEEPEPSSESQESEQTSPISEQYEAGYAARYRNEAMSVAATQSWQAGWTDASRELGGFEDMFAPSQVSLSFIGSGEEARRQHRPFDASCSEAWKRGWIEADIALGLLECSEIGADAG